MPSEIADHVANVSVIDTHTHMGGDYAWEGPDAPDILADLFGSYPSSDLIIAGASPAAVASLQDSSDEDFEARFAGVATAWNVTQFTGYGEAVRIAARDLYEIEELSETTIRTGQQRLHALQQEGGCIALLRDRAKLDHVQTDLGFDVVDLPRASAPFFLRDLSVRRYACGLIDDPVLAAATGVTVRNLATLEESMAALFARCAPLSIAVKSQHAYVRTLAWQKRTDSDVERAVQAVIEGGPGSDDPTSDVRLCLGDWCLARAVELASAYDLPIKLHTGYLGGTGQTGMAMPVDRLRAAHLAPLLMEYPQARFVLMHIAYPYSDELIALAKHFANVHVDLCWVWALNPLASKGFVRRFLHAVPLNKLFAFGDDTGTPSMAYAYAVQMRRWLTLALEEEVGDGFMTARQAMDAGTRLLRGNQLACFDIEGRQRVVRDEASTHEHLPWPYRYSSGEAA
ncbi:MAG TPA: amidohydrolase family protein [Thermomicrobiales bacterium]|nr:amidohydrolase family protein [Thermomicrobiales bacterium]